LKNILLQNDKNVQVVDNPKYSKPTIAQLKKIFTSTSKSSSSYKADVKLTDSDRVYLRKMQIKVTQKFLDKYVNTELHVFENLYQDIFLLNISSDEESFQQFLSTYYNINRNKVDNCTQRFKTYCEYYLKS
jgi:ASC-1-like (ASCH) protein